MKLIVETTGEFQIYSGPDNWARHDRPSVVSPNGLMDSRVANKDLRILAQVNDDATDEGLVEALEGAKGDAELAVQAFASEFPLEKAEPEEKKTRAKPEKAAE